MPSENIANIIKFLHPTADFTYESGNVSLADNGDGVIYISKWTLVAPEPTIASLEAQESAYLTQKASDEQTQSNARRGRKQGIKAKLNLTDSDIPALNELLEDGDDL